VKNRKHQDIENPITNISSWKIIDNLRRSLVAPSFLILTSLTVLFCHDILTFSLLFMGVVLCFPLLLEFMEHLYHLGLNIQKRRSLRPFFLGIKNSFLKILLSGRIYDSSGIYESTCNHYNSHSSALYKKKFIGMGYIR
jgi:cyclic beta-1,2-glucan synthetase